jgi:hypothetical protein
MAKRWSDLRAFRAPLPRNISGTSFYWGLSKPQDNSAAGRIRYIESLHSFFVLIKLTFVA